MFFVACSPLTQNYVMHLRWVVGIDAGQRGVEERLEVARPRRVLAHVEEHVGDDRQELEARERAMRLCRVGERVLRVLEELRHDEVRRELGKVGQTPDKKVTDSARLVTDLTRKPPTLSLRACRLT